MTAAETKMIDRATRKGFGREQAEANLREALRSHTGDSLAHALVYWGLATEKQAYKYIATL